MARLELLILAFSFLLLVEVPHDALDNLERVLYSVDLTLRVVVLRLPQSYFAM